MPTKKTKEVPIGDVLRHRRADVLKKGLREMARLLSITPPHLTDIEKGRRTPSDELLLRISRHYGIDEAELRAGWNRAAAIVDQVATQDRVTAEKVPEFLRSARRLTPEQWDMMIKQARQMNSDRSRRS